MILGEEYESPDSLRDSPRSEFEWRTLSRVGHETNVGSRRFHLGDVLKVGIVDHQDVERRRPVLRTERGETPAEV
jgi:hypothetical protein